MDEPEVVRLVRASFEKQGYILKGQPIEGDITLNGGEIRVDLQAYKVESPPDLIWIECKGDNVPLKELLSDFISLLLILDEYGGQAILACPAKSYQKIIVYDIFLEQLQKNISKGKVEIMNVESNRK